MDWKHYKPMHNSAVSGIYNQDIIQCEIEIGHVETGSNKVVVGSYCKITYGNNVLISEDTTLWRSVIKATTRMEQLDIDLNIFALQQGFYESGLSFDTGWGYVPEKHHPVLMIDQVEKDDDHA